MKLAKFRTKVILILALCLLSVGIWAQARTVAVIGGGVTAAAPACSGSYGNQASTNAGVMGDGSPFGTVSKITGACNGTTASVSVRWGSLDQNTSNYRASVVIYSDNAGSPGTLLGSAVAAATIGAQYDLVTTTLAVPTGATTFWVGVYGEASVSVGYSATTGGTSRTMYNCAAAYNSPPATWQSGCSNDGDYDAWDFEVYMSY